MDEDYNSPRANAKKSVSIAESEHISPLIIGNYKDAAYSEEPLDLDRTISNKQYSAGIGAKRLQGRPNYDRNSSRSNLAETPLAPILNDYFATANAESRPQSRHDSTNDEQNFLAQVQAWVKAEKNRRHNRRQKKKAKKAANADAQTAMAPTAENDVPAARRASDSSDGSVALENLTAILEKSMLAERKSRRSRTRPAFTAHRLSGAFKSLRRKSTVTSEQDSIDAELLVPNAEAVLDNSKTLSYSGGEAESSGMRKLSTATAREKEREAWSTFKHEIVRITHTLRLKGWKRVPRDLSDQIEVERLSGALTNAVYVVSPPKDLPKTETDDGKPHKSVPKLLLRIYGPQVEHLIDREAELQILRRLARKRIGPRLLGTFSNGRFEEYLYAKPLTPSELRDPDVSKQIAKRMRELHDGIELYPSERDDGPFVWKNWDKWLARCEQIGTWCDDQITKQGDKHDGAKTVDDVWKHRGFVCGADWMTFRKTVDKYRKWLNDQYGGEDKIKDRLIFAHNDAQYGNILRMVPPGESPLLLPANVHKQLVVIDFEYANANLPGLEFANHFTEWCYNYHEETASWACTTKMYPTPQEQHRFIRAYCVHHPPATSQTTGNATPNVSTPATPQLNPSLAHSSSTISTMNLDLSSSTASARMPHSPDVLRRPQHSHSGSAAASDLRGQASTSVPSASGTTNATNEEDAEKTIELDIERLMAETRVWRLANSAQWVAWGLVQAKIPGMPDFDGDEQKDGNTSDGASTIDGTEGTQDTEEIKPSNNDAELETPTQLAAHEEAVADKMMAADASASIGATDADEKEKGEKEEEEEAFDYLAYAQDRAWFFWGDAVRLGIVGLDELPEDVRGKIKIVEY